MAVVIPMCMHEFQASELGCLTSWRRDQEPTNKVEDILKLCLRAEMERIYLIYSQHTNSFYLSLPSTSFVICTGNDPKK